MATSVETISNLERRMTIAVPIKPLEAEINQRINHIAKTAKLPGFRPGKVPLHMVQQQYRAQVRDEVFSNAVEASFGDAVQENKLRVAGFPNIEHKPFVEASEQLEYVATFEVFPEIVLGDLAKFNIEKPMVEVTAADVEKTLEVLVKQRVTFEPVSRASKKGDSINIALVAKMDGAPIESTGKEGLTMVLGESSHVKAFDDNLVGGKVGTSKSFEITYPADHTPSQLAGKTVTYEVTFNSVAQPVLPKIDTDFAKNLGVVDGNVDTMKAEVKESLVQEVDKRVKTQMKEQVFQLLLDSTPVDLPKALVSVEINRMMQITTQNLKQRGADLDNVRLEPSMFEDQAKRSTAIRLILGAIVRQNNLQATAEQVRAMVDQFAQSFESAEEVVKWYYADVQRLDEPAALATEENVVNWVLDKAKVSAKKVKFDELMSNAA